ncbi:MAG: HAD family phosphatase [Actinomycetota bacterium]|nr:HAD family phosphatase [Actinomycetota bacterium]
MSEPAAVVFDLDGVLIDSEQVWNKAREELVRERGGTWHEHATADMMGMSSKEWSRYMHDRLGVPMEPAAINDEVVRRVMSIYEQGLPLLPHAVDTVRELAARWPLGLASSSNRPIIELVLERSGLAPCFAVVVSSEEVDRGKPAPDVYLAVARGLGVDPKDCVAIEDSTNGIKSAVAAGMRTIAVPNPHFPPADDALATAAVVVQSLAEVTPELVASL